MPPFNEKGPTPMSVGSLNDAKTSELRSRRDRIKADICGELAH